MKIREVTSATNSLIKVFRRALADGTTREGWLAIEGPTLLEEALGSSRAAVRSVLVRESARDAFERLLARLPRDAELSQIPDQLFERVARTEAPRGIASLVELAPGNLESALAGAGALVVVACGIQDPGNLGAMIRSAQALGAAALVALKETVSPFNPKAVRASAGAVFRLPIVRDVLAPELMSRLRAAGASIVAADRHSPMTVTQADLRGKTAFWVGNEAAGLPKEILDAADARLSIPIRAGVDSLNAAAACSIFLYEAARQRGFKELSH